MEIRYCEQCGVRIPAGDVEQGCVRKLDVLTYYCAKCRIPAGDASPHAARNKTAPPPEGASQAPVRSIPTRRTSARIVLPRDGPHHVGGDAGAGGQAVGARAGARRHESADGTGGPARGARSTSRTLIYAGAGVLGVVLLALLSVLALGEGQEDGKGEAKRAAAREEEARRKREAEAGAVRLAEEQRRAEEQHKAEEGRLKDLAAKLEAEKQEAEKRRLEGERRKAEEERKAAEAARLEEERKKAEDAAKAGASAQTEPGSRQPDAAAAKAERARPLLSAVLKETAPLVARNRFADAAALLERKLKDPAWADAAELLGQEKADVEAVAEFRRQAVEALRQQAGRRVTLKKGGGTISGRVKDDPKSKGVTLDLGGAELAIGAEQIHVDDIVEYAPKQANAAEDARLRGLLFLYAGNVAKAKECFTKAAEAARAAGAREDDAQLGKLRHHLDRILALELGDAEVAALRAWERAERLFAAKDMEGAKAAYEAFERDHGKTQTAAKQAATLKERFGALEKVLGPPPEIALDLGGGVKLGLVLVKAGEFEMGANDGDANEKPAHKVKIGKPFYIGKYEVTVAQFRAFVEATKHQTHCEKGGNKGGCGAVKEAKWLGWVTGLSWKDPGFEQTPDHPVVLVSWNDAQAFCAWLSKHAGRDVRLPTEAQWEYAARGPQGPRYAWGDKWDGAKANHGDSSLKNAGFIQWRLSGANDGFAYTAPAGTYRDSASWCGAFEMSGNVWEWVQDWFHDKYYADSPPLDPKGPASGTERVLRGGSWLHDPGACRSARRHKLDPNYPCSDSGFRVALDY